MSSQNPSSPENLVAFIKSHGKPATYNLALNKIIAITQVRSNGGVVTEESFEIEPTFQAVRDWLGY